MRREQTKMLKAQAALRHAVAAGAIKKSFTCSMCGVRNPRGKDGRTIIHGHHHRGYDAPFDVQWLCAHCHRKVTPSPKGERNPTSKLKEADVRYIRSSKISTIALAKELGVSRYAVDAARNGRSWKHVTIARVR